MSDVLPPWMRCPVCDHPLARRGDPEGYDTDERCARCGYASSFSYGLFEEQIGDDWFTWSYDETPEERAERHGMRADALNKRRAEVK